MKGDDKEIGRTGNSSVGVVSRNIANVETGKSTVSWQEVGCQFAVPCPSFNGGVLPRVTIEVWTTDRQSGTSASKKKEGTNVQTTAQIIGVAAIEPDHLVSESAGLTSVALLESPQNMATKDVGDHVRMIEIQAPQIVVRITPNVGQRWARRAIMAAMAAKRAARQRTRSDSADQLSVNDQKPASVLYMTSAEGSARTWRTPVTPDDPIPTPVYEDILELTHASLPACCPQSPTLAIAPFSDVGIPLGGLWIGPRPALRHALVAYRPLSSHNLAAADKAGKRAKASTIPPPPPPEDEVFLRCAAAEAEGLLREVRAQEMRAETRNIALSRVQRVCKKWHDARSRIATVDDAPADNQGAHRFNAVDIASVVGEQRPMERVGAGSLESDENHEDDDDDDDEGSDNDEAGETGKAYGELFRAFLRALEVALPGVSIYIGLLVGGGRTIRYVACTRNSTMAGKELTQGEGISFSCVGPRFEPYLIYPPRDGDDSPGVASKGDGYRGDQLSRTRNATMPRQGSSGPGSSKHMLRATHFVSADTLDEGVTKLRPNVPEANRSAESDSGRKLGSESAARSLEEEILLVQKAFRGQLDRARVARLRQCKVGTENAADVKKKITWARVSKTISKLRPRIPRVFDYDGRIGWPFVCVPLVASLGASSVGVVGMDTFEQMGCGRSRSGKPEAGVVKVLAQAAR